RRQELSALRVADGRRKLRSELPRPVGEQQAHRALGRTPQKAGDQLDARRVRPVEVVERQRQGLLGGEESEQLADRRVCPVALVLRGGGRLAQSREGREDLPELAQSLLPKSLESARALGRQVVIECVGEGAEGQVSLELGA